MNDLNMDTSEHLDQVPALEGPGFQIVRYGEERGRFTTLRQLDEVPRLAESMEDVTDALTVGGEAE